jgi:transposase
MRWTDAANATLEQRAADVLAYFDRPGTSNGPSGAVSGGLEHLRGTALGFRPVWQNDLGVGPADGGRKPVHWHWSG